MGFKQANAPTIAFVTEASMIYNLPDNLTSGIFITKDEQNILFANYFSRDWERNRKNYTLILSKSVKFRPAR